MKYKFVSKIVGSFTLGAYWIVRYEDGLYSYGYQWYNDFSVCPHDFDTIDETIKAIENRESFLANGDTVMF